MALFVISARGSNKLPLYGALIVTCTFSSTMLSSSLRHVSSKCTRLVAARAMSTAVVPKEVSMPSVKDVIVSLTFVDSSGARRKVPGFVGKSLWETAVLHEIDLGPASNGAPVEAVRSDTWTEPLFGEGPTCGFDMVVLHGNGVETAPPKNSQEERMLSHYWEYDSDLIPESRLASVIILTKAMDGMMIYVPDRIVDNIP